MDIFIWLFFKHQMKRQLQLQAGHVFACSDWFSRCACVDLAWWAWRIWGGGAFFGLRVTGVVFKPKGWFFFTGRKYHKRKEMLFLQKVMITCYRMSRKAPKKEGCFLWRIHLALFVQHWTFVGARQSCYMNSSVQLLLAQPSGIFRVG